MNLFIPYWLVASLAYMALGLIVGWVFVGAVNLSWEIIADACRKAKLWRPFLLFIADKLGRKQWQDIAEVEDELLKARGEARDNWQKAYAHREALQRVVWRLPEEVPFESDEDRAAFQEGLAEADALLKEGIL